MKEQNEVTIRHKRTSAQTSMYFGLGTIESNITPTKKQKMKHPNNRTNNKLIDTTNEEWSEIIRRKVDLDDDVVEEISSSTNKLRLAADPTTTVKVDDVNNEAPGEQQDIQSLRKQDPFLHYSNSTVRNMPVVDMKNQLAQKKDGGGLRRNCVSYPASIQQTASTTSSSSSDTSSSVSEVKRQCKLRASYCEHHADDTLMDDLFDDHYHDKQPPLDASILMGQSRRRKVMLQLLLLLKRQSNCQGGGVEEEGGV